jgi:hypothetical protein
MDNQVFVVFVESICRENDSGDGLLTDEEEWVPVRDLPSNRSFCSDGRPVGQTSNDTEALSWCREYNAAVTEDGNDQTCCTSHAYYLPVDALGPFERIPGYGCSDDSDH